MSTLLGESILYPEANQKKTQTGNTVCKPPTGTPVSPQFTREEKMTTVSFALVAALCCISSVASAAATFRVVGGAPVSADDLSKYRFFTLSKSHQCGASLIHKDIIMSAAHCIAGGFDENKVVVGATKGTDLKTAKTYTLEREVIHPKYNFQYFGSPHDIVLYKLSEPVTDVTPIKLAESTDDPKIADGNLTVLGMGLTRFEGKEYPPALMKVEMPVIDTSACKAEYLSEFGPNIIKTPGHFCAGGKGKQACLGDSGGPVINTATMTQVGIVSFGYDCGSRGGGYPDVYTRVGAYKDFIQQTICQCSSFPPAYCSKVATKAGGTCGSVPGKGKYNVGGGQHGGGSGGVFGSGMK